MSKSDLLRILGKLAPLQEVAGVDMEKKYWELFDTAYDLRALVEAMSDEDYERITK
jgi:hypothetical protein